MDKAEVARRQLGTALHLFLHDMDPVSVHCLACGGGEIAQWLAEAASGASFETHVRETFPDHSPSLLRELRNKHWNAFKHATTRKGLDRKDEALLAEFKPDGNEHWLFIAWHDYGQAGLPLPIEAQVFEVWYFAKYPDKASPDVNILNMQRVFPDLAGLSPDRQKAQLVEKWTEVSRCNFLMSDAKTDPRPLVLS
jgi:hypothetical protein